MTDGDGFIPDWDRCQHPMSSACTGIQLPGFVSCLAHLRPQDRARFLQQYSKGGALDFRGTIITPDLLHQLMATIQRPHDGVHQFGPVDFRHALFTADVEFTAVIFAGPAQFSDTRFAGDATFSQARFTDTAEFRGTRFEGRTTFGQVVFNGPAVFERAQFGSGVDFTVATFSTTSSFIEAQMMDEVTFVGTRFDGQAWFEKITVVGDAQFNQAQFNASAEFDLAHFNQAASFLLARFASGGSFGAVQFDHDARFASAHFAGDVRFTAARCGRTIYFDAIRFESTRYLGPIAADAVSLNRASFPQPVVIVVETGALSCEDTRFEAGVVLRARYALLRLDEVIFGAPSSLVAAAPFTSGTIENINAPFAAADEQVQAWTQRAARLRPRRSRRSELDASVPMLLSLRGSDLANLVVTDVDLRWCHFAGAHHLDQLRIEGRTSFGHPPKGWRWTSRQALAEEHRWRAASHPHAGWHPSIPLNSDWPGWQLGWREPEPIGPERLAVLYRGLRKALEDGKNEAGAGDFYYGEIEARRHAPSTSTVERVILFGYWLVSGYGQRATRALAALVALLALVTVILVGWGLPADTAGEQMTGTIQTAPAGHPEAVTITVTSPTAALPPVSQRWTWRRTDTAASIALNAMIFRNTSQRLTATGSWTDMIARLLGPTFLALALLAIRARVKR